uniref:26S proteasome non-ATPase regulatory subunit 4 homolog n=1 Tax=Leersia perrieri TaxID=77586 RepID=A0A0D9VRT0_9ORYZ
MGQKNRIGFLCRKRTRFGPVKAGNITQDTPCSDPSVNLVSSCSPNQANETHPRRQEHSGGAAMVLEATMICIDNSEWMRNGDYAPSRFQAQADAVNLICGAKTQSNPENTVGVMTMAGKGVRVLVTPTSDLGKILACMHGLEVGAEANLAAAIQVAQLALKHRQNKRQQQRIIAFIGSPVKYDKKVLETIGKKLKKNNVALDIVDFGETDDEKPEKLEALISAVNSSDSSHIVHVPPGDNALSDVLISTPIFTGEEGGSGFAASAAAAAATGAAGFEFDVDPNVDPELALALRLSMEEERARQEAIAKKAAEESSGAENKDNASSSNTDSVMAEAEAASNAAADDKKDQPKEDDDAQLLQQALAMSMEEGSSGAALADAAMAEAAVDDQDLALALQMSVQEAGGSSQSDMSKVFEDRSFVTSILNSLPGVDPNDPSVKDLLASLHGQGETCLDTGGDGGYYTPASHLLEMEGLRILLDCPVDLSALAAFSPVPLGVSSGDAEDLIRAVPYYRSPTAVAAAEAGGVDAVLVSSATGLLGLPFLTRLPGFVNTKVYVTEVAARMGRLMMTELVDMHREFVRCYGPDRYQSPVWMEEEKFKKLLTVLQKTDDKGNNLAALVPLYSLENVEECMQKIQHVKYGEEVCFNGLLMLKATSSGLELGNCVWTIKGPRSSMTYLPSAIFVSAHALDFDYNSLKGNDVILFSDFSSLNGMSDDNMKMSEHVVDETDILLSNDSLPRDDSIDEDESIKYLCNNDDIKEEIERISFICSCITDAINSGGSVLIPTGRLGVILLLLEHMSETLHSSDMQVPIFMISEIAEEMVAFTNALPEWLCKPRQEKQGVDAELTLKPFMPLAIQVLGCSFLSGIKVGKIDSLLRLLKPKLVLFPEGQKSLYPATEKQSWSFLYYSKGKTIEVPNIREEFEVCLATEVAFGLQPRQLDKTTAVARLKAKLLLSNGQYVLAAAKSQLDQSERHLLHKETVDASRISSALQEKGFGCSFSADVDTSLTDRERVISITSPGEALVKVTSERTTICSDNEKIAHHVYDALRSICNGI